MKRSLCLPTQLNTKEVVRPRSSEKSLRFMGSSMGLSCFVCVCFIFIVMLPFATSWTRRSLLHGRLEKAFSPRGPNRINPFRTIQGSRFALQAKKPSFITEGDSKYFEYNRLESDIYKWWEDSGYFKPSNKPHAKPFVLPMPPPNVTGYLHMGHAIFVALQDIMARFHRMKGYSTLWLPGT